MIAERYCSLPLQRIHGPLYSVARDDDGWIHIGKHRENANPAMWIHTGIAKVVLSARRTQVAGEDNSFLRQPRNHVATSMARANSQQFQVTLAIIQHQLVMESELRVDQAILLQIVIAGSSIFCPGRPIACKRNPQPCHRKR